jgi:lysozyme
VDTLDRKFPIQFVLYEQLSGMIDKAFEENWLGSKKKTILLEVPHYYRPNENSLEQAALFIKTVRLHKGDLPPVLDIERLAETQSMARLKIGLRRWLEAVRHIIR